MMAPRCEEGEGDEICSWTAEAAIRYAIERGLWVESALYNFCISQLLLLLTAAAAPAAD